MQPTRHPRLQQIDGRMRTPHRDFVVVLLVSLSLLLMVAVEPSLRFLGPLRLLLGFVFVLFVPGYCLVAALFPREDDLDGTARTGLSLGLSVAWVPVLALILDRLPWGLQLWPMLLGEYASVLLFVGIALWRRSHLTSEQPYAPSLAWQPRTWWRSLPTPERRTHAAVLAAVLVATLSVIWIIAVPSPAESMTEFYMLGNGGLAEDFPRKAAAGEELRVTLGVANREGADRGYRVEVWAEDVWTAGRRQQVAVEGPFGLARDENREWPVAWRMPWPGPDQKVEFLLFSGDSPDPYRRLHLYLNVEP